MRHPVTTVLLFIHFLKYFIGICYFVLGTGDAIRNKIVGEHVSVEGDRHQISKHANMKTDTNCHRKGKNGVREKQGVLSLI